MPPSVGRESSLLREIIRSSDLTSVDHMTLEWMLCLQRDEDTVGGDLYHITKSYDDSRSFQQKLLRGVYGLLNSVIPGYSNVRPILTARVPIVKFSQQVLGLECDLCVSNV